MRGVIAAVAIIAVVSGVVLMGGAGGTPAPVPAVEKADPGISTPTVVVSPVKIVRECEDTTSLEAWTEGRTQEVMKIVTQSEGRPITFIDIPEGWITTCSLDSVKDEAGKLPGRASYEFEVPRDDTYYFNLRAKWMDSCGNSVWVKVDDGGYIPLEDNEGKIGEKNFKWAWHQLEVGGKPKGIQLAKGKHTLLLNTKEDGPCLDQWVITTEASRPVGEALKAQ